MALVGIGMLALGVIRIREDKGGFGIITGFYAILTGAVALAAGVFA